MAFLIKRKGNQIIFTDKTGKATQKDFEKAAKKHVEEEFEKMLKNAKIGFKKK